MCPYLATTYYSLSLSEILLSLSMKHSPWMCILNTCVVFFSASYADQAKSAPSSSLFRLDYCNSLLAGLPDNKLNKLQPMQNHPARIVLRKHSHVSEHHCLEHSTGFQFKRRSNSKSLACAFSVSLTHTMAPYLSDLLRPYHPSRTLSSLDTSLLSVPSFCLETFDSNVWKSLPLSLRKTQCF